MLKPPERNGRACAARQCGRLVIAGMLAWGLNGWGPVSAAEHVPNAMLADIDIARSEAKTGIAPDAARRVELVTLVRQDCGSCHGLTLKGGLGPALLPEALRDKSADYLKTVILYGRPDTAMPPWKRFLSEAEAEWIVVNLQRGFPSAH